MTGCLKILIPLAIIAFIFIMGLTKFFVMLVVTLITLGFLSKLIGEN